MKKTFEIKGPGAILLNEKSIALGMKKKKSNNKYMEYKNLLFLNKLWESINNATKTILVIKYLSIFRSGTKPK
ncbi:MAG: hypothetical protein H0V01_13010 [Bacteroidetes bacterium]|nr:hypothetical protein [Bacteroidota bacterium]